MPKNNGFPAIWTIGQIAEEMGVQYRAVRYVTHRRRTLIEPSIVLRGINFYDKDKRDEIVAALAEVACPGPISAADVHRCRTRGSPRDSPYSAAGRAAPVVRSLARFRYWADRC